MLNLGTITNRPSVAYKNINDAEMRYEDAQQAYINYKNLYEIVTKAQETHSLECMQFAEDLIGTSLDNITVSEEELKEREQEAYDSFYDLMVMYCTTGEKYADEIIAAISMEGSSFGSSRDSNANRSTDRVYNRMYRNVDKYYYVTYPIRYLKALNAALEKNKGRYPRRAAFINLGLRYQNEDKDISRADLLTWAKEAKDVLRALLAILPKRESGKSSRIPLEDQNAMKRVVANLQKDLQKYHLN